MFNEFYTFALAAVKDVDARAQYELFPDVMLVTSAVINSLKNSSGNFNDDVFSCRSHALRSVRGLSDPLDRSQICDVFQTFKGDRRKIVNNFTAST